MDYIMYFVNTNAQNITEMAFMIKNITNGLSKKTNVGQKVSTRMTTNLHGINILEEVEKYCRSQREREEQELAEIIQKYVFVVGSEECKHSLMEILPEGANIICLTYIDNPSAIYAIRKSAVMDYIIEKGAITNDK